MKYASCFIIALLFSAYASAGDNASGPILYTIDLSAPYSKYLITDKDKQWSDSLIKNLKYKGKVIHFEQTSLVLLQNGTPIKGSVYQAKEAPNYYYVINGDAMLKIGDKVPYSPGVGGFSMHAKESRKFIACLNCLTGGVPFLKWYSFLSWSKIGEGNVSWNSTEWARFE